MQFNILILFAVLGACLGSFLNVAAHRSIQGRSWWGKERSVCESCGHVLSAGDLIPIISFIILKGKCRYCRKKFGFRYFLVELISAFMGAVIAARYKISFAALLSGICACSLVVNSLTDIENNDVFDLFAISFAYSATRLEWPFV